MLVESAAIHAIDYDLPTRRMWVRFVSRERYVYFDVPPPVHAGFVAAESKGRFFLDHILGRYAYSRRK